MDPQVVLWRICNDRAPHEAVDLSGRDTIANGGRWHHPGLPLVYLADSISLAVLETLAHVDLSRGPPPDSQLVRISGPRAALRAAARFDRNDAAHAGWDAKPPTAASMDWGTSWARSGASLLACVPSAIVPEEWNVLLNPAHHDAGWLRAQVLRRFHYDLRLGNHTGR